MSHHAIHFEHVSCAYDGSVVLRDVSLRIGAAQFAGIIGPSGSGKTTLLRTMLGMTPRVSGHVTVAGQVVQSGDPPKGVAYVPQIETVDWSFPVTVENIVLMGLNRSTGWLPWASKSEKRQATAMLERLGIQDVAHHQIRELSGGQQQRAFLARALVGDPEILVLDEPTASIDIKTRDDILHLLADLNALGTTIVMTTHELNSLAAHLPMVVCVNGSVIAQGTPETVFTNSIMSRTFNGEMRVVRDPETGNLLVAEAGSHGPLASLSGNVRENAIAMGARQ